MSEATVTDLNFGRGSALRINAGPGAATVSLTPGTGVHRLAIMVTVTSVGLSEGLPIQLCGELYAGLSNAYRWLGPLHMKQLATRNFGCQEQLVGSLSDSQLRAIETLRDGRDLSLRINLDAVLLYPVDDLRPVVQGQELAYIPAEAWARQLEALGTAVVMEVLVPLPFDGSELRRAVGRIRESKGNAT